MFVYYQCYKIVTRVTISHIRREIYEGILCRTLWEYVEATNRTKLIWIVSHFSCGAKLLSWRYEREKRKVEHCRTIVEEQWRRYCIATLSFRRKANVLEQTLKKYATTSMHNYFCKD